VQLIMTNEEIAKDRDRWLDERRALVTASDIGPILGLKEAYRGAASVYWEKVTGDRQDGSIAMRVGTHFESFVVDELAAIRPDLWISDGGLYVHDDLPWMGATFDRFARHVDPGAGSEAGPLMTVQIKTAARREGWGDEPDGQIPRHYLAQVLWEMAIGNMRRGLLVVMFLPHGPMRTYVIDFDDDAASDLTVFVAAARRFRTRIATGVPPPADWRDDTTRMLKRIYADTDGQTVVIPDELGAEMRAAKDAVAEAQQRWGLAENQARELAGPATTLVTSSGDVIAARSIYPNRRASVSLLRQRYPDIAAEVTVTNGNVDKMLVKPPRDDR
jgi:putative phage-type endonuclease